MVSGGDHTASPPLLENVEDLGIEGITDAVVIGRGGFGSVYRALQPALSRTVAVKLLTDAVQDETARLRFERECFAMGMLGGHPNIIQVYDQGFTADGRPFIIMDFMAAGSVGDRLGQETYDWREILPLSIRVAGALETAHRAGVLHRDIKPENILVSKYGEPQLADFGIARLQGAQQTRTDTLTASIAHAAPELIAGKPPSVHSDLYALGSTLYELLTGKPAFLRDTDQSLVPVLARIGSEPVPDLRSRGVPDAVATLVERLMAKEPTERFDSAEEFARAVQALERGLGLEVTSLALIGDQKPEPGFDPSSTTNVPIAGVLPDLAALDQESAADAPAPALAPPPPPAPGGTPAQAAPAAPPKRRTGILIVAGVLAVVLAGGAAAYLGTRGGGAGPTEPAGDVVTADTLQSLRLSTDGVDGNWVLDPDLSALLVSNPDSYVCRGLPQSATVAGPIAVSYRSSADVPAPPRIANVLRAFAPGSAATIMRQLTDPSCTGNLGNAQDVSSTQVKAGEDAVMISYIRSATAARQLGVVVLYARQGDVISQIVYLTYHDTETETDDIVLDDSVTDQLIGKVAEQLQSLPTS